MVLGHGRDQIRTLRENPLPPAGSARILPILNIAFTDALLSVMENDRMWHALSGRFGDWRSVYAQFYRCACSGALIGCSPRCGAEYNRQRRGYLGIDSSGAQQRSGRSASANRVAGERKGPHDLDKSSLGNDYVIVRQS